MFQIGKTIVSEEIIDNDFVCNLTACKGACCIDGDAGAPLEDKETEILVDIYQDVKPFLRAEGIAAIEEQGAFVKGEDGEWETPLVNGSECAYVVFSDNGTAKCGLEDAYNEGITSWKKPVSCHLYPVRTREYTEFTGVNYHKWEICDPACSLGEELKVPVYKFVKEALVRKFGEEWYSELELVAQEYTKLNNGNS
ncbi:MAG: DUF3109 family protein [Cellulophaga sp.]|uniref:DUF3109 family protein n=1 Tax=unclassified Cellulophaga TaxID=2634405 RepID=UPI000C2BD92E|nr:MULTISPECIES: DUF3109 family protein [unclassified Cellulophaga]MDO6490063.1 DUF3109 family protein [Cellulophaga sp. 2_MG-2023]MDO6494743.1 DUF3109 family protein [Cellulophaga sp. 3_MG-2023]PKB42305.1 uncharacterized protein DUF3109 [Cellulophaga sp. RHA19]